MKNNIIIILLAVVVIIGLNHSSQAQISYEEDNIELKKFEVGGHFTIMFQNDFEVQDVVFHRFGLEEAVTNDKRYESGFGGRFTYNVNRNLAVEGEVNFTPSTRTARELARAGIPRTGPFSGGEKTQFLGGVKYGIRRSKFGAFGKIRPGAIRFNAFPKIFNRIVVPSKTGGNPDNVILFQEEKPATFFNIDVGGVLEYYPTRKLFFRADVGDTIIRYNAQKPKDINPNFTRHNLQINVGIGFRF